jgi:hypothetical protein
MTTIATTTGTIVTTKPAKDVTTDIFKTELTLNFANGNELRINVNTLNPDIIIQATLHGLKQKLCDAAAIPRDTTTGRTADIDDKYAAVKAVYDRLTGPNPTWNAIREGETKQSGGIFLRAMMVLTGKSHTEAKANIEKLTKEQVSALKQNPKVLAKMHELEMAAAKVQAVDSDALLNQLGMTES